LHLRHGRAFPGIHPRRGGVLINIVLASQLESLRVHRADRVSANRWHSEIILRDPKEIDAELFTWVREGHTLTA
jgi:hypothetical protein